MGLDCLLLAQPLPLLQPHGGTQFPGSRMYSHYPTLLLPGLHWRALAVSCRGSLYLSS